MSATPERDNSANIDIPWPLVKDEDLKVMVRDNLAGTPLREIVMQRAFFEYDLVRFNPFLRFDQRVALDGVFTVYGELQNIFDFVNTKMYQNSKDLPVGLEPIGDGNDDERLLFLGKRLGLVERRYQGNDDPDFQDWVNYLLLTIDEIKYGQVLETDPTGFLLIDRIVEERSEGKSGIQIRGMDLGREEFKGLYDKLVSAGALRDVPGDDKLAS